ncbi:hypothetical protein ACFFLM_22775 [Deinococcus oregonensis]|uniref:Uncharacterized protein n=1 Tax=Deinococcus oregonensis TaxID=1805970 RepID=A0ABV6B4V0_9DEIO
MPDSGTGALSGLAGHLDLYPARVTMTDRAGPLVTLPGAALFTD